MNPPFAADWCVIMPIKGGRQAKSRLGSLPDASALADDFATKTLAAVLACPEVKRVVIVTTDKKWRNLGVDQITTMEDHSYGLNEAICLARDHEVKTKFLVVIPSDLPLLDPYELATVLEQARFHPRAFVRDKDGDGTTLLTALSAPDLLPQYGASSADSHLKSGAIELSAPHSVRFDVDTLADLRQISEYKILE